jgi:L-histidine N-alpha-methyltransferase
MSARFGAATYVPLDISESALHASADALLESVPRLYIRAVVGDFTRDLDRVQRRSSSPRAPRLFAFLGSTIGNLDELEAPALVTQVAAQMRDGDRFLLGVDLVKDEATLVRAYDDEAGVTAAFNKNVLAVIDRELDASFDLDGFDHVARWVGRLARIEMRLRARTAQTVRIGALDATIDLAAGEEILTEMSRKFTRASVEATLAAGRMALDEWYVGDKNDFALALARKL